jgi:hypothetical protein
MQQVTQAIKTHGIRIEGQHGRNSTLRQLGLDPTVVSPAAISENTTEARLWEGKARLEAPLLTFRPLNRAMFARELVSLQPEMILARGTAATAALQEAARMIRLFL